MKRSLDRADDKRDVLVHLTSGPRLSVVTNSPFFVPIAPPTISTRCAPLTCRSGASDPESSGAVGHFRSRRSLRPEPRVTSSPKVCPGERLRRSKTEHTHAPYTHRVFFVESATRASRRQFQRDVCVRDRRSRRSAKFVTSVEWRPVRWCLRTALCLDGERGERRIEQTKDRCSSRDAGGSPWRTLGALFRMGSTRSVHQVSLDFVGAVERRWGNAKSSEAYDCAGAADSDTSARADDDANRVRRARRRAAMVVLHQDASKVQIRELLLRDRQWRVPPYTAERQRTSSPTSPPATRSPPRMPVRSAGAMVPSSLRVRCHAGPAVGSCARQAG
jgi:hypothetical protein